MGFKTNGLGLRGLRVNTVQCDHETELVPDLADVDARFLPAILLTSVEWMLAMRETTSSPMRWPRTKIWKRPRLGRSAGSKSTHLSFNKLSGHFDPGGNKDFSGAAFSVG